MSVTCATFRPAKRPATVKLIPLLLTALLLLPAAARAAVTVNATVEAGFERRVRPGTATPLIVTLTADAAFTGTLEINALSVEQRRIPIELTARQPKRIPLVITWPMGRSLRISVLDRNDSPVRQLTEHNYVDQSLTDEMVHILEVSSSPISLPGLQRATPPNPANSNSRLRFVVSHCEPAALPEHSFALGSAQVILIGDLAFDEMTVPMRTALLGWIDRGGTLIVRGGLNATELSATWLAPYLPLSNLTSDQKPFSPVMQPNFNLPLAGAAGIVSQQQVPQYPGMPQRGRTSRVQPRGSQPTPPGTYPGQPQAGRPGAAAQGTTVPPYQPGGRTGRTQPVPSDEEEKPDATAATDAGGGDAADPAVTVPQLSGALMPGAVADRRGAFWSMPFGNGRIVLLAADPGLAPLRGNDEAGWLIYNCLDAIVAKPDLNLQENAAQLIQQLTQTVAIEPPPLMLIGLFLFAYIVLVGPLNFFILSRLGRRELAWITIPAIVLVFSVLMYATGRLTMGGSTVQRELMLRFISCATGGENYAVATGIFSNGTDDYTLRFPAGALDANLLNGDDMQNRRGGGEEADLIVPAALPEQSEPVTINQWSWRYFSCIGGHATPLRVRYDLGSRRLTFTGDDELAAAAATGLLLEGNQAFRLKAAGDNAYTPGNRGNIGAFTSQLTAMGYLPTASLLRGQNSRPRLLLQREVEESAISTRGVDDAKRTEIIIIYPELTGTAAAGTTAAAAAEGE